ncbi:helix-turn-helix domain-containing protein [Streptomyces sp. Ac-502]|uniref:helix-turn-helix domain-containing protein n=1 Tax=Streptomyces sp. Ac-502 TaxID=3342801 RepID=UPI0038626839
MDTEPSSPTVHRRSLGKELRSLRTAAGKDLKDAAAALGCDPTRISKIERARGTFAVREDDVNRLCALYGVTDERTVQRLLTMLSRSQKPGWWEAWSLPPDLEVFIGLETDATTERAWEPLLVPGLLQRPEYSRAVLNSPRSHRPDDVEDLLHLREGRQRLLHRSTSPLELWAILDENVLRRPIGGPDVMRDQLRHLHDMVELPNVTVQVVPLSQEDNAGLAGAFTLLHFADDPTVVYVDSAAGNLYLEKERDARRFTKTFDLLTAAALDRRNSRALIERAAKEIGP